MAAATQGCRVTAVDPNRAMEPYARKNAATHNVEEFQLVEGFAESLPFEDATFDRAVCTLVRPSEGTDLVLQLAVWIVSVMTEPRPLQHVDWQNPDARCNASSQASEDHQRPSADQSDTKAPSLSVPFLALVQFCKVFCSVPDLKASLKEVKRILKPSGKLLFWDHVYAEDSKPLTRLGQNVLNPLQQAIADGCHLNRCGPPKPLSF